MSTTDTVRAAFEAYLAQDSATAERLLADESFLCHSARSAAGRLAGLSS
jgi:hypothetical protein